MSGDDNLTAQMMTDPAIRANGVISVASNVVPGAVERMCRAFGNGRTDEGQRLAGALDPLFDIITVSVDNVRVVGGRELKVRDKFRNPLAIKTLMQGLGMIADGCRRPLGKMTAAGVSVVRAAASTVWRKDPDILRPIEAAFGVSVDERLSDDRVWTALACDTG